MILSEFLIPSKSYASLRGPEDTIVLSSRARLARNLRHASFPSFAKKTEVLIQTADPRGKNEKFHVYSKKYAAGT